MDARFFLRSAPLSSSRMTTLPAARAAAQRHQQRAMRIVGALVGLTIVAGGLLTAMQAHASTKAKHHASAATASATHGTVQAVEPVQVKGEGSGIGVATGAVLGGLVGNQMGKGTGNTLLTVGGAVAGGFAGNEVEKNVKAHTLYRTTVKLDDGSVHHYTVGHAYAVGARVQVSGKTLKLAE